MIGPLFESKRSKKVGTRHIRWTTSDARRHLWCVYCDDDDEDLREDVNRVDEVVENVGVGLRREIEIYENIP